MVPSTRNTTRNGENTTTNQEVGNSLCIMGTTRNRTILNFEPQPSKGENSMTGGCQFRNLTVPNHVKFEEMKLVMEEMARELISLKTLKHIEG